jgi:hypothetical protein
MKLASIAALAAFPLLAAHPTFYRDVLADSSESLPGVAIARANGAYCR